MSESIATWWSADRCRVAVEVLGQHSRLDDGCAAALGAALGRRVSFDAVQKGLRRLGLGPPSKHLAKATAGSAAKTQKLLVLGDIHDPFADHRAIDLACRVGRERGTDVLIQLGDLMDCLSVSPYRDGEIKIDLLDEIQSANRLLDKLDAIGAKRKILTLGNHCARVKKYLYNNAPAVARMIDVKKELRLVDRGWEVIDYGDHIIVGKIAYTHCVAGYGAKAHVEAIRDMGHSTVIGHTHRMLLHFESTICESARIGATMGHLSRPECSGKHMHKAQRRFWQLGFGSGIMLPDGVTFLSPCPIVGYRSVVDGAVYEG